MGVSVPTTHWFDLYVGKGLKVIPLFPGSKIPIGKNWNESWNRHLARRRVIENPGCNLGLLLGDIIDVEADCEDSNELLDRLVGDAPHCGYRSSRSVHRLFRNPDPMLTATTLFGIEFRGHRHQSVLPPSVHEDGTEYRWLRSAKFPISDMPPALLEFYRKNQKQIRRRAERAKPTVKAGHAKTVCKSCGHFAFLHKKRLRLEVAAFRNRGLVWSCRDCREIDVRDECRFLRNAAKR